MPTRMRDRLKRVVEFMPDVLSLFAAGAGGLAIYCYLSDAPKTSNLWLGIGLLFVGLQGAIHNVIQRRKQQTEKTLPLEARIQQVKQSNDECNVFWARLVVKNASSVDNWIDNARFCLYSEGDEWPAPLVRNDTDSSEWTSPHQVRARTPQSWGLGIYFPKNVPRTRKREAQMVFAAEDREGRRVSAESKPFLLAEAESEGGGNRNGDKAGRSRTRYTDYI